MYFYERSQEYDDKDLYRHLELELDRLVDRPVDEPDLKATVVSLYEQQKEKLFLEILNLEDIIVIGGGPSGEQILNRTVKVSPLNGLLANKVYPVGTKIEVILKDLENPTQYPVFTNPLVNISFTASNYTQVNDTISGLQATIVFDRGKINPQYSAESAFRAGEAISYTITLNNASTTYTDTNTTGIFTLPDFTRSSSGEVTVTGKVEYAQGPQPTDSDGNNYDNPLPAGSVQSTKTVTKFIYPFYYGGVEDVSTIDIETLTQDLSPKYDKPKTITFTLPVGEPRYLTFAYDKSYGNLKSIKDQMNWELIQDWTKRTQDELYIYTSNAANTDRDGTGITLTFEF